jgi:predicted esterase
LVGFSQGASLLIIHHVRRQTKIPMVLVAPFLPEWLIQEWRKQDVSSFVPAMVCIGENDTLVTPEQSIDATILFEMGTLHYHPHGHVVPTRSRDKQAFVFFVKNWVMK